MVSIQEQLALIKKDLNPEDVITIPDRFFFHLDSIKGMESVLSVPNWDFRNKNIEINFLASKATSHQALGLLVLFCWKLKAQGCSIYFNLENNSEDSASLLWQLMGAKQAFNVLAGVKPNFDSDKRMPLVAVRDTVDIHHAIDCVEKLFSKRYAELTENFKAIALSVLINALEHGKSGFKYRGQLRDFPVIFQACAYRKSGVFRMLVADLGQGIHSMDEAHRIFHKDSHNSLSLVMRLIQAIHGRMAWVSNNIYVYIEKDIVRVSKLNHAWHGTFACFELPFKN
jgi:hypothetical protein